MIQQHLIIRADATTRIGNGHLMRCLALAQGWKAGGGEAIFVSDCESQSLKQRLCDEGFGVVDVKRPHPEPDDLKITAEVLTAHPRSWIVLDGYHFESAYQRQIKKIGNRLLVIDDMAHLDHYCPDILLNQNLKADQLVYSCDPSAELLLGHRYVLLRQEFLAWQRWSREIPQIASRVMITFGGSDPDNRTLMAIRALQQVDLPGLEVVVVAGANNPHLQQLRSACRGGKGSMRLLHHPKNIPQLMSWADLAVCAGGSTCWELAYMMLPAAVVILSENQRPVAEGLEEAGAAINLGWHHRLSAEKIATAVEHLAKAGAKRKKMAARGRELIDGRGVQRILTKFWRHLITLRRATENDCRMIWNWSNDPDVRLMSFTTRPIPYEDHVRWFESKLKDPDCFFYIAENGNHEAMGQVRYAREGQQATISVSLDQSFRGKGYGSQLIRLASKKVFETARVDVIHAYVKAGNSVSIKVFQKAGFNVIENTAIGGHPAIHLILRKKEK